MAWANWNAAYTYMFGEYSNAADYNTTAWQKIGNAQGHTYDVTDPDTKSALQDLVDACNRLYFGIESLIGYKAGEVPAYTPLWMMKNTQESAGGITMDDILNNMLSASFEQLQKFIGIEDAYRVALWNAPFNSEFYSALARGFQKWS